MNLSDLRDAFAPLAIPLHTECCVHVLGAEPSPAWPALLARHLLLDAGEKLRLRVVTAPTRGALLERVEREAELAIVPASLAVRAIAGGLDARIVAATVSSGDLSHVDDEPEVLFPASAPTPQPARSRVRAVFVASSRALRERPAVLGAALRCYWRAADLAALQPSVLARVVARDFDLPLAQAQRETWRAMASWRLEPRVYLPGLRRVVSALAEKHQLPAHTRPSELLEERFFPAESPEAA